MALSTAAFPRLADQVADGELGELRDTVSRVLRVIMFLTIPAALGLAILAEPVTALLFERGEFTAFDTELTAGAVMFYSFGMIAQAGVEIHSRGFYALGDTRTPVIFAVVALGVNLVIAAVVWDVWEADGLALAVSVASWVEWLLLYAVYVRRVGAETEGELRAIGQFALCAGVMVVVLALGFAAVDPETMAEQGAVAVLGTVAGAAVYAGMARWLGVPELDEAVSRVRGRMGGGGREEESEVGDVQGRLEL
jgi:putative peptidoglycan lipid II flippase